MTSATKEAEDIIKQELKKLAQSWRERLRKPEIKTKVESGELIVSPELKKLLESFPEE
jgi:glutamyl-tRNA reductase